MSFEKKNALDIFINPNRNVEQMEKDSWDSSSSLDQNDREESIVEENVIEGEENTENGSSIHDQNTTANPTKNVCVFCNRFRKRVKCREILLTKTLYSHRFDKIINHAVTWNDIELADRLRKSEEEGLKIYYHSVCLTGYDKLFVVNKNAGNGEWHFTRQLYKNAYAVVYRFIKLQVINQRRPCTLSFIQELFMESLLEQYDGRKEKKDLHFKFLRNKIRMQFAKKIKIFKLNKRGSNCIMAITQAQTLIKRLISSQNISKNALQHLNERSIIQIKGPDVSEFLQGLITNDINHLSNGVGSMFAMFLNTKGRTLYDSLIYKTAEDNSYLIECDTKVTIALQKHLKIYKVKRKIDISQSSSKVYVLFNPLIIGQEKLADYSILNGEYKNKFPENSSDLKVFKDILIFKDPRVAHLGFRIIAESDKVNSINEIAECDVSDNYKKLRYSLGIGEGEEDLLSGNSFPLECNCDYLHGVSFHKGCYIGQELTARTYHTGVIRKRLMPLIFTKIPTVLPENNIIMHNGKNLGKFRGIEGNVGLALLRMSQALEFGTISIGNGLIMQNEEIEPSTSISAETTEQPIIKKANNEIKYFECALCNLREKYEYFGKAAPFQKKFILSEDSYVIEDPFAAPKQGEIVVLGAHCVACNKMVCKDLYCSVYYNGTYCIHCAKSGNAKFPKVIEEKLNKIVR
ncbi:unnamed protein product [Ceutorhynchus assimilis]|uniref:Uncharacterized protein n=1 Tax=Ceutorhynchus assimilis TaxID=467358 RepID=A0A9N9MND2_9CUCU|nr:unnamed protein product [Ceutorhynchus assimilis]